MDTKSDTGQGHIFKTVESLKKILLYEESRYNIVGQLQLFSHLVCMLALCLCIKVPGLVQDSGSLLCRLSTSEHT